MKRLLAGLLLVFCAACDEPSPYGAQECFEQPVCQTFDSRAGLQRIVSLDVPNAWSGSPHLTDLTWLKDGTIVVANTMEVTSFRRDKVKGMTLEHRFIPPNDFLRCTTSALHEPSNTFYCASLDAQEVIELDVATQEYRQAPSAPVNKKIEYRDIHVQGSFFYAAAFKKGLLRRAIAANGSLGDEERIWEGDVIGVAGEGSHLVLLDREKGLVRLDPTQTPPASRTLALNGPLIHVRVRGDLAVVSLGSKGVVTVDLTTMTVVTALDPKCVVFTADVSGSLLAAGCSTGLVLYDLARQPARLAGFDPATFGFMDVVFHEGELYGADWRLMKVYRTNPAGHIVHLDAVPGLPLKPGAAATVRIKNDGELPITNELFGTVPPLSSVLWQVPVASESQRFWIYTENDPWSRMLSFPRRANELGMGDTFPIQSPNSYVIFIQTDCTLQWPVMEDIAWLAAHGEMPDGLKPLMLLVLMNDADVWSRTRFTELWPLPMASLQTHYPEKSSLAAFEQYFSTLQVINGADVTSDWWLDKDNRIYGYDRIYRGTHPLR